MIAAARVRLWKKRSNSARRASVWPRSFSAVWVAELAYSHIRHGHILNFLTHARLFHYGHVRKLQAPRSLFRRSDLRRLGALAVSLAGHPNVYLMPGNSASILISTATCRSSPFTFATQLFFDEAHDCGGHRNIVQLFSGLTAIGEGPAKEPRASKPPPGPAAAWAAG